MILNKELFDKLAADAAKSPRLLMNYDLRDSADENGQLMLNCILFGTKEQIHCHCDTNEVLFCVYGSLVERFYDEQGNLTEEVTLTAGGDVSGVLIEKGWYHTIAVTTPWLLSSQLWRVSMILQEPNI